MASAVHSAPAVMFKHQHVVPVILAAALALGGCPEDPASSTPPTADVMPETSGDADAAADTGPDAPVDASPDSDVAAVPDVASDQDAPPPPDVPDAAQDVGDELPPTGSSINRLTVEQVSKQLSLALDVQLEGGGPQYDNDRLLTPDFSVPLGGVDFVVASKRNHTTKLQTLLVARAAAWEALKVFAGTELDNGDAGLLACTAGTCPPPGDPSGAWEATADDLHWRIFGRPPTDDELTDMADLWNTLAANEPEPVLAWIHLVYAMLTTAEFWHH